MTADDAFEAQRPPLIIGAPAWHFCDECHVAGGHRGSCSQSLMRGGHESRRLGRREWFYRWVPHEPAAVLESEWVKTLRAFVGDPVSDRDLLIHTILAEVEILDQLRIPSWRHKRWRKLQKEALEHLRRVADEILRTGGTARG